MRVACTLRGLDNLLFNISAHTTTARILLANGNYLIRLNGLHTLRLPCTSTTHSLYSHAPRSIYLVFKERYCLTVFGFGLSHDIPRLYPSIIKLCQSCVNRVFRLLGFGVVALCKMFLVCLGFFCKNWYHFLNTVGQYSVGFVHSRNLKQVFLFLYSLYSVKLSRGLFTNLFIMFGFVHSSRNKVFLFGFNGLRDLTPECSLMNKSMTPSEKVFLSYCLTVFNLTMLSEEKFYPTYI